jgi:hypothetical protein
LVIEGCFVSNLSKELELEDDDDDEDVDGDVANRSDVIACLLCAEEIKQSNSYPRVFVLLLFCRLFKS